MDGCACACLRFCYPEHVTMYERSCHSAFDTIDMAIVACSSFGQGANLAMLPGVDFMNHSPHAATPRVFDGALQGGQPVPGCAVFSERAGACQDVCQGEELFVSYSMTGLPAEEAWLNFGFVPNELKDGLLA